MTNYKTNYHGIYISVDYYRPNNYWLCTTDGVIEQWLDHYPTQTEIDKIAALYN